MSTNTEETRAALDGARAELDELLEEQGRIDRDLDAARREDHAERMEAARGGGRIASAIGALKSRARKVALRRESLPDLIWTARLRALELEAEYCRAVVADLKEPEEAATSELREADEKLRVLEVERQSILDRANVVTQERTAAVNRARQARIELEELERVGPQAPYCP